MNSPSILVSIVVGVAVILVIAFVINTRRHAQTEAQTAGPATTLLPPPPPPPHAPTPPSTTSAVETKEAASSIVDGAVIGKTLPLCGWSGPVEVSDVDGKKTGELAKCPVGVTYGHMERGSWRMAKVLSRKGARFEIDAEGKAALHGFIAATSLATPDVLVVAGARVPLPLIDASIGGVKQGRVTIVGARPTDPCAGEHCGNVDADDPAQKARHRDPRPTVEIELPPNVDLHDATIKTTLIEGISCCT